MKSKEEIVALIASKLVKAKKEANISWTFAQDIKEKEGEENGLYKLHYEAYQEHSTIAMELKDILFEILGDENDK